MTPLPPHAPEASIAGGDGVASASYLHERMFETACTQRRHGMPLQTYKKFIQIPSWIDGATSAMFSGLSEKPARTVALSTPRFRTPFQ
jgi:hypothetical protein